MMSLGSKSIKFSQSFSIDRCADAYPAPGLDDLRIVVVDNYDSFTYNLVQYLAEISGAEVRVFRNDRISVRGLREEMPTHIVVSPGPCTPHEAGISLEAISVLGENVRSLGSAWDINP